MKAIAHFIYRELFGPIDDLPLAETLTRDVGCLLMAFGVLFSVLVVPSSRSRVWGIVGIPVGLLHATLGVLIWRLKSRVAAYGAAALIVLNVVGSTWFWLQGRMPQFPYVALGFAWLTFRAVGATVSYHRLIGATPTNPPSPPM